MGTWRMADGSALPDELVATLARDAERQSKKNPTLDEADALERLIDVACQNTGQSSKVADFLLSWWDAEACGGFDPTDVWGLDYAVEDDVATIFEMIRRIGKRPYSIGYGEQFEGLVALWRPDLGQKR